MRELVAQAGLKVVDSMRDADFVVVGTFGTVTTGSSCGTIRNFRLELQQQGIPRVSMVGRGCEDEIVRESIAKLAGLLR